MFNACVYVCVRACVRVCACICVCVHVCACMHITSALARTISYIAGIKHIVIPSVARNILISYNECNISHSIYLPFIKNYWSLFVSFYLHAADINASRLNRAVRTFRYFYFT